MKRRFTALMTTLILSVIFSISASAYDVEVDGIYYNLISKGNIAEVTHGDLKYSGSITIPSSIKVNDVDYAVTSIGKEAFYECSGLTSITIPNSVTSIGNYAFCRCSGLTSVTIPNSVTSIGDYAFASCSGLTSVTIPNSVTSIGDWAFASCSGLTSVTIPNSVTSIGDAAFEFCSGLTSVTIPNSVTSIGNYAFNRCSGLTSVTIPNSVTSIGCGAFIECSGLTSVTIPNSVTSIGDLAFYGCTGITQTIIINDMFVFLPKGYEGHYSIPENISTIIGGAFASCSSLTSVTIPNSVTSIGDRAFEWCTGLTSVTIPNSVTSIGVTAFAYCSSLNSVTISNSVTSIGSGAFSSSNSIKKLYYDCTANPSIYSDALKELYVGDNISIVYDFFKDKNLSKIVLGKNVTHIRAQAFYNSHIEEFTITGEEPPYLYPNVFGTQDLSKATLNVPESKIEYYQTTEPWSLFGKVLTLSGETPKDPEKCSTPSILFSEGKLQFTCNTEGAKFYYTLNSTDVKQSETLVEANTVALSACYEITCTAKAEGFANSDVATAKLYWLPTSDIGTNINTAKTRGVVIQSAGGFITLSGLDTNERVDFFAIDGVALGSATATNGTATFSATNGTIVIAKIGKESVKIALE